MPALRSMLRILKRAFATDKLKAAMTVTDQTSNESLPTGRQPSSASRNACLHVRERQCDHSAGGRRRQRAKLPGKQRSGARGAPSHGCFSEPGPNVGVMENCVINSEHLHTGRRIGSVRRCRPGVGGRPLAGFAFSHSRALRIRSARVLPIGASCASCCAFIAAPGQPPSISTARHSPTAAVSPHVYSCPFLALAPSSSCAFFASSRTALISSRVSLPMLLASW